MEILIGELAHFLNISKEDARSRVESSNPRLLAEDWERLNPVTPEEVSEFYVKHSDPNLYELIRWNESDSYFQRVEPLLHYHGMKILEVGAGNGSLCISLSLNGNDVTYCDISETLFAFAQQRFSDRILPIKMAHSLEEVKDNDYDIVVAIDVLEHIHPDSLTSFLKGITGHLKDRGFFYHRSNFSKQEYTPQNINTAPYWDKIWSSEGKDTWRQYPLTFKNIVSYIETEETVLDVGCGVGVLLSMLKPQCKEVAGLDISPSAIEILESKGIKGKVGVLPDICFPDKSFDVVVATETIEHLDNPAMFLKEAIRVSRNKVILSTPDNVLSPAECAEHRQLFTKATFEKLLSQFFDDFKVKSFTDNFPITKGRISLPTLLAICKVGEDKVLPEIKTNVKIELYPMHFDHSAIIKKSLEVAGLYRRANGDYVKGGVDQGVQISLPVGGGRHISDLTFDLINMKTPPGTTFKKIDNLPVDKARNKLVEGLSQSWLFFMDADQSFPVETLERLMSWNVDIVSGLTFQRKGEPIPMVYKFSQKQENGQESEKSNGYYYAPMVAEINKYLSQYESILDISPPAVCLPRTGLIECDGVSAGCLLINKRVFDTLEKPYFECVGEKNNGEDFYFCRKAQDAGFKIYCDPSVLCGHYSERWKSHKHFLSFAAGKPYPWKDEV